MVVFEGTIKPSQSHRTLSRIESHGARYKPLLLGVYISKAIGTVVEYEKKTMQHSSRKMCNARIPLLLT